MKRAIAVILATSSVLFAFAICLAELQPCEYKPIEVLNENSCGQSKWISVTDSLTNCQILCLVGRPEDPTKECGINPSWIGGTVVFDERAELMFYFEPSTVEIAEITAEALQTTLCQIAENPKYFDGGRWFVAYNVVDVK
jgi:hypothetical protein